MINASTTATAPLRILHVVPSLDPRTGGPAVAMAGLARAQKQQGLDLQIFNAFGHSESDTVAKELVAEGIPVTQVGPCPGVGRGRDIINPQLHEKVRNAQVVHIHALWEEVQHQAARAAQQYGIPYIIRPCGMLDPWSLSQSWLKKKLYLILRLRRNLNRAAAIHYTAAEERDLASPLKLKARSIVEPNGINLEEFAELPDASIFRQKFPQIGDRRILLFLSRIHHKKGLDLLIPAFKAAQISNCVLVIAGPNNDGYQPTVEGFIKDNGLENDVIFTGILRGRDRIEAMAAADLFVLPSYQENFGIVVVEALACGTPVIISDKVNIHHEITQSQVGGVVPTRVDALTDALKRWMSDNQLLKNAASRSRDFVFRTYDWNQIAARWVTNYHQIAQKSAV